MIGTVLRCVTVVCAIALYSLIDRNAQERDSARAEGRTYN